MCVMCVMCVICVCVICVCVCCVVCVCVVLCVCVCVLAFVGGGVQAQQPGTDRLPSAILRVEFRFILHTGISPR